jgi:hypothetical protein
MTCLKRNRLVRRYTQAVARFDRARESLLDRIAFCSQAESRALHDQVECAGDLLHNARAKLDEHIRQHCCLAEDVGISAHTAAH